MDDMITLIQNIALLLEYFVPGYVMLRIICFGMSKTPSKYIIGESIAISYFIRIITHLAKQLILPNAVISPDVRVIILVLLSALIGVAIGYVYKNGTLDNILQYLFSRTSNQQIWDDVITTQFDNGVTVRITDKNGVEYTGPIDYIEENVSDPWIAIKEYSIKDGDNRLTYEDYNCRSVLLVKTKDAQRVQLFYTK